MRSSSFKQVNMILAELHNVRESVMSAIAQSVQEQQFDESSSPST